MAMRSIVTSQPDVACDVCGRRLLRGEHADVFLAAGERRMVCELCSSRATHVGWLREADAHSLSARHVRRRGPKTLLGRLRQLREREPEPNEPGFGTPTGASPEQGLERELSYLDEPAPGASPLEDEGHEEPVWDHLQPEPGVEAQAAPETTVTSGELKVALALEIFNASHLPARISGVARALGEPCVTVRPVGETGSAVAVIVAWDLCWYRYEVDVGDQTAGPQLVAEGTELEQLSPEDRAGGVSADESGALLAGVA
jgi:hypothetical protein